MLPEHLKPFSDTPIPVLDDGHVLLVDVLGDEQAIVNAARVSYGAGTKRVLEDRHLLRYLMRHQHTTPFEMCEIVLRVRVPMDTWRQWIRHRTASVNEYSTRYSEAIDSSQRTLPGKWRAQAVDNKQGSDGTVMKWPEGFEFPAYLEPSLREELQKGHPGEYLTDREARLQDFSREVYEERLAFGVAREVARKDLPLSTYTEAYWKCDLHNLLHFLTLRLDPHAQKEIRDYANAIAEIVKVWVPNVWEAFEDYRLQAVTFTRMEIEGLRAMLRHITYEESTFDQWADAILPAAALAGAGFIENPGGTYPQAKAALAGMKNREALEFLAKLARLLEG